jgi:hypothetical protein
LRARTTTARRGNFEVFTTDAAFNAFWRDSLFTEGNGSADFFGDAHFVIPANQHFAATHPRANTSQGVHRIDFDPHGHQHYDLLTGQDGSSAESLYVSVALRKGKRSAITWRFDAPTDRFVQVGAAVEQPDYEYELYPLATALYPDCPSAGYEWLRFGRVLGPDSTSRNENWQVVRYAAGRIGYIDLAPDRIVKLSDADFPFWQGWEKRAQGQLVNPDDGVCGDESVIALKQENSDASRKQLPIGSVGMTRKRVFRPRSG